MKERQEDEGSIPFEYLLRDNLAFYKRLLSLEPNNEIQEALEERIKLIDATLED
ncbi:MAG: hypothetical protein SOY67_05675 [Collinsella sp.]|nr:hypothetical protein [Collinsella sp.]